MDKTDRKNSEDSSSSPSSMTAQRKSTEGGAGWSASGLENRAGVSQGFDSFTLRQFDSFRRALGSLFVFFHPYRYYDWDAYEHQRKVAGYWFAGAAC